MCVLKFKHYWLKKHDSRKVRTPFFRASAECKYDSCLFFTFYIDDQIIVLNKKIVLKFESEHYKSPSIQMVKIYTAVI